MINSNYCLTSKEFMEAKAILRAAKQFGFIEKDSFEAMEERCLALNKENREKKAKGELVYGVVEYSFAAYLQYELTQFKLDFLSGKAKNYTYGQITQGDKIEFYNQNQDLFTNFFYEKYDFDLVEEVIEKRIREEEFYGYIKDILCQLS